MKVLQIINSHCEEVGGAERLSVQLHRGNLQHGVDSHLLCLMKAPASRRDKTYSLRFNTPYHPAVLFRLVRFLRQPFWRDVDVIHVHLFPAQPLVALAARLAGSRAALVTTEHNTFNRRRQLPGARALDALTYRSYRKVACISQGTRAAMQAWLPELAPKLLTVLNGIDVSKYAAPKAQDAAPKAKPRDQPLIVLSAGRLTGQKNYEVALRAIQEVRFAGFEYWIAGRGEHEGALREQAKMLGLQDKARFLGFRDDLPALLQEADVFLSTSRWEGFGLSVLEAMASGLAVVVSDVPGVTEVVGRHSNGGFFVHPDDASGFARELDALLSDPALRQAMGANARRRAAHFDLGRMVEDYLRLYGEVQAGAL